MLLQNEKIIENKNAALNMQFGHLLVSVILVRCFMAFLVFAAVILLLILKSPDIQPHGFIEIEPEIGQGESLDFIEIKRQVKQRAAFGRYYAHEDRRAKTVDRKKIQFFENLMPFFLVALEEVHLEREFVLSTRRTLGTHWEKLDFIGSFPGPVKAVLSPKERKRLLVLADKYRVASSKSLLERVNIVPVSLMLAQAALESSWGKSRFALEGNNYFGMWTWGETGLVPKEREEGKNHKVAKYPNPLHSARAYLLTLNRLSAYEKLREIRKTSMDSLELAQGLLSYSARRQAYVDEVRQIISTNALQRYDL